MSEQHPTLEDIGNTMGYLMRQLQRYGPIDKNSVRMKETSDGFELVWKSKDDLFLREDSYPLPVLAGDITYSSKKGFIFINTLYKGSSTKTWDGFQESDISTPDTTSSLEKVIFGIIRKHVLKAFDREMTSVEKYLTQLEREVTGV